MSGNPNVCGKGMPENNTVAYYQHSLITDVKSFITLGPAPAYRREPGNIFTTLHFLCNL